MDLRPAQIDDAPGLGEGMKQVQDEGPWLATDSDRTASDLTTMFKSSLEAGHIVFALEDEGRIVGGIGVHPTGVPGVLTLGMYILESCRGGGWGRKMVQAALEAARREGARRIELDVFPDNARAITLYSSLGFEVEGLRRDRYQRRDGSLRSELIMARILR